MSLEIESEFKASPHRVTNPRVIWDQMTLVNNLWMPAGYRFRDGDHGRLLLHLPRVPQGIHLTVPNAIVRLRWVTASASGNACKFYLDLSDILAGTDSYDPAAFDFSAGLTDTSPAAGRCNELDFAITGANPQPGRELIAVLRRDRATPDANDSLAADVIVTSICFHADKAA